MVLTQVLVPIFICVVLPVSIVLIVFLTVMNSDNKRAQILIKAIESGKDINADKLADALRKPRRTPREVLNLRLLRACIFTLLGLGCFCLCIGSGYTGGPFTQNCGPLPFLGTIFLAIGLSYLIVYFVSRKQLNADQPPVAK